MVSLFSRFFALLWLLNSLTNTSLFVYNTGNILAYILVYIDDLLSGYQIAGRNANCVRNIADAAQAATASGRNCGVNPKHRVGPQQNGVAATTVATQRRCDRITVPLCRSYIKLQKIMEKKPSSQIHTLQHHQIAIYHN